MDYSNSSLRSNNIIVTGCGTEVGKTVVSAVVVTALQADYWKPVQCGEPGDSDTATIKNLVPVDRVVHAPHFDFKYPVSPHQAARLENRAIDPKWIHPPETARWLVIETAGGLMVPWNLNTLAIDGFCAWNGVWIVVSRHYLGSINHTLLTVEALRRRGCSVGGLIFNGAPHPDTEEAILQFSQLPVLGRLYPEAEIHPQLIQEYACRWKPLLQNILR